MEAPRCNAGASMNPLIETLEQTVAAEADKRDGYEHGFAGLRPRRRSDTYTEAWLKGAEAKRVAERGA